MKRKLLALLLAVMILVTCFPIVVGAADTRYNSVPDSWAKEESMLRDYLLAQISAGEWQLFDSVNSPDYGYDSEDSGIVSGIICDMNKDLHPELVLVWGYALERPERSIVISVHSVADGAVSVRSSYRVDIDGWPIQISLLETSDAQYLALESVGYLSSRHNASCFYFVTFSAMTEYGLEDIDAYTFEHFMVATESGWDTPLFHESYDILRNDQKIKQMSVVRDDTTGLPILFNGKETISYSEFVSQYNDMVGKYGTRYIPGNTLDPDVHYDLVTDETCPTRTRIASFYEKEGGHISSDYNAYTVRDFTDVRTWKISDTPDLVISSAEVQFLTAYDDNSRSLSFGDSFDAALGLYTLDSSVDSSSIASLLNHYVLVECSEKDGFGYSVTGLHPLDSHVGTPRGGDTDGRYLTALRFDDVVYPCEANKIHVADVQLNKPVIYHLREGIIVGITALDMRKGKLNGVSGNGVVLDGIPYPSFYVTDTAGIENLRSKVNEIVNIATSEGYVVCCDDEAVQGGFQFWSSSGTSSVTKGEAIQIYAGYYNDEGVLDTGKKAFLGAVSNANILSFVPRSWSDAHGQLFELTGKNVGQAFFTVTNPANGNSATLTVQVLPDGSAMSITAVPELGEIEPGRMANFYNVHGLVVDNYKADPISDSAGSPSLYHVTMSVFNKLNLTGAVIAYNADGSVYDVVPVGRKNTYATSLTSNVGEGALEIGDLFHLLKNERFYSGKSISSETPVDINVPADGYLCITNSTANECVFLANVLDLTLDGLLTTKDVVEHASKTEIDRLVADYHLRLDSIRKLIKKYVGQKYAGGSLKKALKGTITDTAKNWTIKDFKDVGTNIVNDLKKVGIDLAADLTKQLTSVSSAFSIGESLLLSVIPTGQLINLMFDSLKYGNQVVGWGLFCKAMDYTDGICLYSPPTGDRYISDAIEVQPQTGPDPKVAMRAYMVANEEKLPDYVENAISKYKTKETYNICLYEDGDSTQSKGECEVRIPISEDLYATPHKQLKVYRHEADGRLTDMNAKVVENHLVFQTDHFSYYTVLVDPEVIDSDPPVPSKEYSISLDGPSMAAGGGSVNLTLTTTASVLETKIDLGALEIMQVENGVVKDDILTVTDPSKPVVLHCRVTIANGPGDVGCFLTNVRYKMNAHDADWQTAEDMSWTAPVPCSVENIPTDMPSPKPDSGLRIETDGENGDWLTGWICGQNRTVQDLLAAFEYTMGATCTVYDTAGSEMKPEDSIATGCVLRRIPGIGSSRDAVIVLSGDVLGNGKNDITQLVRIAQLMIGTEQPNTVQIKAADWNSSGGLDIVDLTRQAQLLVSGNSPVPSPAPEPVPQPEPDPNPQPSGPIQLSGEKLNVFLNDICVPLALGALREEVQNGVSAGEMVIAQQDSHFWDHYLYALMETQNAADKFGADAVSFNEEYSLKDFYPGENWTDTDRNTADLVEGDAVRQYIRTVFGVPAPETGLLAPGSDKYVFWHWEPGASVAQLPQIGELRADYSGNMGMEIAFSGEQFDGREIRCLFSCHVEPSQLSPLGCVVTSYSIIQL